MCNIYEPATEEYLRATWAEYEQSVKAYKPHLGPRDDGPFVTKDRVLVGQWGMIRPGASDRVQRAPGKDGTPCTPMSTNNARVERITTAPTYRTAWKNGDRCLIPAITFDEPYWGTGKNIWWRFARKDGEAWAIAGLWSEWKDFATSEVVPNYTMITMNADAHPLFRLMHHPEKEKRTVVPLERVDWEMWLNGSNDDAMSLIQLPSLHLFKHGAADPAKQVKLAIDR